MAFARFEDDQIVAVKPLPCHGDGCLEATRALFEQAIEHAQQQTAQHATV
jgi:hypothetical protein